MLISLFFISNLSFYFLRLHEYRPETADTSIILMLLVACLFLYIFYKGKNLKVIHIKFMVGFVLWALISHISFGYLEGTIDTLDELLPLLMLFLISAAIFVDRGRLEFYLKFICLCAFVMALHGVDQALTDGYGWTGMPSTRDGRIRYIGAFADPNDLGMLFVMSIPIYFYFLSKSKFIFIKLTWFLAVLLLVYAIYLTNSRGTFVALFALFLFYGWHHYSKILVLTFIGFALPIALVATRLSTIGSSDSASRQRIDAWTQGIYMLRSDPIFGVGHDLFTDHHYLVAHSSFVQTFAEIGLIGYFFWLGLLGVSIVCLYKFVYLYDGNDHDESIVNQTALIKDKNLCNAVLYSHVGYSACAFFISRSTQPLLFLMCGMSAGMLQILYKDYSNYNKISFKAFSKPVIYAVICSILFIYTVIKLFW